MSCNEQMVIKFLTELYNKGQGYSAINTARSALSTFLGMDGTTIGNAQFVKRFLKGVFELRPSKPRYSFIWDVNIVLEFLKIFYPYEGIPLSHLTYKLVMLLALSTSQRTQTLKAIKLNNMVFGNELVMIPIYSLLKQTSAKNRKFCIYLKPFGEDPAICVVTALKEYIKRTEVNRKTENQLFISFQKPFHPVSTQTISRWLKLVLNEAGIDISLYKAHSTRAASCSKAKADNVLIDEILKNAGWKKSATFKKFYDKIIVAE